MGLAKHVRRRMPAVLATTMLASALMAAQAQAHALISPAVAKTAALQQFTLSVPTEKDKLVTTKVELTVPAGFAVDSFEAEPGWKRSVQTTGSGSNATVQRITWTGGRTPTGEDSIFRFNASAPKSQTYVFSAQQTYSDGSIVDWSGPESSDSPAPRLQMLSSLGGTSDDTLALVGLVVAGVALLLSIVGLSGSRRPLT